NRNRFFPLAKNNVTTLPIQAQAREHVPGRRLINSSQNIRVHLADRRTSSQQLLLRALIQYKKKTQDAGASISKLTLLLPPSCAHRESLSSRVMMCPSRVWV
ncbi:unnamed protein product, partial [Ectocarpus sp. 4 AP-2014]